MEVHVGQRTLVRPNSKTMRYPEVIIKTHGDVTPTKDLHSANLVIVVDPENKTFFIYKNRWGYSGEAELPLSLLTKVLEHPVGTITVGWEDNEIWTGE